MQKTTETLLEQALASACLGFGLGIHERPGGQLVEGARVFNSL